MANILILSLVFPPDSVSTAQIMGELAVDLKKLGHNVTVLTTIPHYNRDLRAESAQPLEKYWWRILRISSFHGIPVYHSFIPQKGKSKLFRLLSWFIFHIISTAAGVRVIKNVDIIITPSPPLTIGISAWILSKYQRAHHIYNVQEMYPDLAIRLGVIKNKLLIKFLYALENFVYKKAEIVTVIAPTMRSKLFEKGVDPSKVKVIPNFVDIQFFHPLPKKNSFSKKYKIYDKFVVSYAGNIGPAQGLDVYIKAAYILRDKPDIHFFLIGDGTLRKKFQDEVLHLRLANFTFLPYQNISLIPQIYAASDTCLVPLARGIGFDAIPSKVYRIMACARPVLALTDDSSDLSELIKKVHCGVVIQPGQAENLANTILSLYNNRDSLKESGQRGHLYVAENCSRSIVIQQYDKLVKELVDNQHIEQRE